jgi:glycine oxidase
VDTPPPAAGAVGAGPATDVGAPDVAVIGGGVIGLAIAWKAAGAGLRVTVIDPAPGSGASQVAAGMLAPVAEAQWGEEPLLEVSLRSASAWPVFAEELEAASGRSLGYRACGTLIVGADSGDRSYLEELLRFERHLGLEAEWCSAAHCRELEPLLAPGIRGGILAHGDNQVDPRLVLAALLVACARSGVTLIRDRVVEVQRSGARASGVRLAGGGEVAADCVVLAAGCWSSTIDGLPPEATPAVRPVKGQVVRLRGPAEPAVISRSVRCLVAGTSCYLVPRADGEIVLGSTMEELGFDTTVTAGAVYSLLRDASRVLPFVTELALVETQAGLRPGSRDNAPIIGDSEMPGLVLATGHFRNGILLTPVTTEIVLAHLTGKPVPEFALRVSPGRPGRRATMATAG